MKKRIAALMLGLMLLISCAAGAEEIHVPTEEFFNRGRTALMLLAEGLTDEALEVIGFAFDVESGLTEETFRLAVEQMTLLDKELLQTEVALCWLDDLTGVWHLGIPLAEPVSWDVEVLVLDSRDLQVFCGYSVSDWGALEAAAELASQAYWNIEYMPGEMLLMADE